MNLNPDIIWVRFEKEKIFQKMAGNRIRNFWKGNDLPINDFAEKFPLHHIVFPLKCDVSFSLMGSLTLNASHYV